MRLKEGFITHNIMEEQMMIPVGTMSKEFRGIITFNKTASYIIDCLKKDTTKEEILKQMLEKYDVDEETAIEDIEYVTSKLMQVGAIDL